MRDNTQVAAMNIVNMDGFYISSLSIETQKSETEDILHTVCIGCLSLQSAHSYDCKLILIIPHI